MAARSVTNRLLALALLVLAGCSRDAAPPQPNVILVVIDTLRADKLGCYGQPLPLSPNIDRFAAEGVRFSNAFSQAPWTLPSFASIFTSMHPVSHGAGGALGVRGETLRSLSGDALTMAEVFKRAGYHTGAVVNVPFLSPNFGLHQGFGPADYDFKAPSNNVGDRRATETTDIALKWIRSKRVPAKRDKPFFYLIHYFDPHLTYDPPAEFRAKFADARDQEEGKWIFGSVDQMLALRRWNKTLPASMLGRLEKLYNGEIAYTDQQFGRFMSELAKMGLNDSTVVLLTADHGEEFNDHGGFEHGHTVYDELLHVPLIMRFPPSVKPATVSAVVRHIDIAPTLCALAGIGIPPSFQGENLLGVISGASTRGSSAMAETEFWGDLLVAWRNEGYKVIRKPDVAELYHVATDPKERENLAGREADRLERALAELDEVRTLMSKSDGQTAVLSAAQRQKLITIGYLTEDDATEKPKTPADGD